MVETRLFLILSSCKLVHQFSCQGFIESANLPLWMLPIKHLLLFDELRVRPFPTAPILSNAHTSCNLDYFQKHSAKSHAYSPIGTLFSQEPSWPSRQLLNVSSFNIKALITSLWAYSACFCRNIEMMSYKNVSGDSLSYFYENKNISHSVTIEF